MSGTDYTKKAENGNTACERDEGVRAGQGAAYRPRLWLYELRYLYKSRAERFLLAGSLIILAFSWCGMGYLAAMYERPAAIEFCLNSMPAPS